MLGILVFNALHQQPKLNKQRAHATQLAITICVLYAASDEFHQLFISGRSGEVGDIAIDSIAASIGIIFASYIRKYLERTSLRLL